MTETNGYNLSRNFWDFAFENPERIKPAHAALFFFAVEHCNRLGWKAKFGLPTGMAMEAIGLKSYNTYNAILEELIEFGMIKMVERSKNQYSSNIVALSKNDKAQYKALDKALMKHGTKHTPKQSESTVQSTVQSIDSIDKPITIEPITIKPITNKTNTELVFPFDSDEFLKTWGILVNEKKWKGKSQSALQASLKLLSQHSEADAIQMMENSIAGGWQGLFEIKKNNNASSKKTTGFSREGVQDAFNRRLAEIQSNGG